MFEYLSVSARPKVQAFLNQCLIITLKGLVGSSSTRNHLALCDTAHRETSICMSKEKFTKVSGALLFITSYVDVLWEPWPISDCSSELYYAYGYNIIIICMYTHIHTYIHLLLYVPELLESALSCAPPSEDDRLQPSLLLLLGPSKFI